MALTLITAEYSIVLSDAAQVATYQAQYPKGFVGSPASAAIQFAAPINPRSGTQPTPPRIALFGQGNGILATNVPSATWAAGQTITGQQPLVALVGAPGGTITWTGFFVLESPTPLIPYTPLSLRRWCNGFEIPDVGEGGSGTGGNHFSRDS